MYQNYIFDLYGTLADIRTNENSPCLWRKMSDIYSALGAVYTVRELKMEYKRLVGEAVEQAARKLAKSDDWQRMHDEGEREKAKMYAEPDIAEVFAVLYREKGVRCDREQARFTAVTFRTLSRMRLGLISYFDGIFISSEEGVKKPSPLFFQRLLERYDLEPSTCVMIGNDQYSDIAGARAVGMDCLYIHTSISPQVTGEVDADYLVMDGDFRKIDSLILR